MEKQINLVPTPQMERIHHMIFDQHSPHAFAIVNQGKGPVLAHQGHHCWVKTLAAHFICGSQQMAFSHLSQPPYFIAVAKETDDGPLLMSRYQSGPDPLFESNGDVDLTGHIIAYSQSADGVNHALAQAVFLPRCSHLFVKLDRCRGSMLLEDHPELCKHLLMCSVLIEDLLDKQISR